MEIREYKAKYEALRSRIEKEKGPLGWANFILKYQRLQGDSVDVRRVSDEFLINWIPVEGRIFLDSMEYFLEDELARFDVVRELPTDYQDPDLERQNDNYEETSGQELGRGRDYSFSWP